MHLRQPNFAHSAGRPFKKSKEKMQKLKDTGYSRYICQNELKEIRFQHDMDYSACKYLARWTASDWVLRDKVFSIAGNPKYDGYQRKLVSMVYTFFDKKSKDASAHSGTSIVSEN